MNIEKLINRKWTLNTRPDPDVVLSNFKYEETAVIPPKEGEVLLKIHYLNLAPVMRMYMMADGGGYSTEQILDIGDVIHGRGVAEVIASEHDDYQVGNFVQGQVGWQTYKLSTMTKEEKFIKMTPRQLPIYYGLSALGMTGYSAYCGFVARGQPKKGEAVLVSGAAGGVGSLVVQIAKAMGCSPVIGIAGGQEKCAIVKKLGADATIDYKSENVNEKLATLMPNGLDIYFDNVGGEILETAIEHLRKNARIVLCGAISEYARKDPFALKNYGAVRQKEADLRGFFVYNHGAMYEEAEANIANWIREGKLKALMDIEEGFKNVPQSLIGLYSGTNIGKRIVKVSEEEIIY